MVPTDTLKECEQPRAEAMQQNMFFKKKKKKKKPTYSQITW